MGEQVRLAVGRWPDVWRDEMGGRTVRSGGMWWPDGKGRGKEGKTGSTGGARRGGGGGWPDGIGTLQDEGGMPDGGGVYQTGGGVARRDGVECRTGICGGRTGWEGVRTGRTHGTKGEE
jgi:hypothetical protein